MKKFTLLFTSVFIGFAFFTNAQIAIQLEKCLGGSGNDAANAMQKTSDGGYIVAGSTTSLNDGDVTGNHIGNVWIVDIWVVKLSSTLEIEWKKCLGGTDREGAFSVQQTFDGGYIVAGYAGSTDGDVTGLHFNGTGYFDMWLVKLSSDGDIIEWQKCIGDLNIDYAYDIKQTPDSGYIVLGKTGSTGFDSDDIIVLKLTSKLTIDWQKTYGGSGHDYPSSIQLTDDGGYIFSGGTFSNDGDLAGINMNSFGDSWIVKLFPSGEIDWQKNYGGTNYDNIYSIIQTKDGGYIAAGSTYSNDGDASDNHGLMDGWIIKLSKSGGVDWKICLGGSVTDGFASIIQTADSGYLAAGFTASNDGNVTGNHGGDDDAWIVKLDKSGGFIWQQCLGGSKIDALGPIVESSYNSYAVAGSTTSIDGEVTGYHGPNDNGDMWVVTLKDPSITVSVNNFSGNKINELTISPNPTSSFLTLQFNTESNKAAISLYNLLGEKILQRSISSIKNSVTEQLDLSDYRSGTYFLSVKTEKENLIQKIVRQ